MGMNASIDDYFHVEELDLQSKIEIAKKCPWHDGAYGVQSWGSWFHKIAPYAGRITPSFAHWLVKLFTEKGQVVLDPFCGIGTIPLEANLQGRQSIGIDLNPYAVAISKAKMDRKPMETQIDYLKNMQLDTSEVDLNQFSDWIRSYYNDDTLKEIVVARDKFKEDGKDFLLGCLIGISQGHRPGHLSKPCAWTIPYKPKEDDSYRAVIPRMIEKVRRTYKSEFNLSPCGTIYHADSRSMPLDDSSIDCVISSPPYFDTLDYISENRLRIGVMGYTVEEGKEISNQLITNKNTYLPEMEKVIVEIKRVLKPNGLCVLILGDWYKPKKPVVDTSNEIWKIMEKHDFEYIDTVVDIIPPTKSVQRTTSNTDDYKKDERKDRVLIVRKK